MTTLRWYFPPNAGGEETGLNDGGIESFRREGSLARETVQNSCDAALPGLVGPVRVMFERRLLDADALPDRAALRQTMESCHDTIVGRFREASQREQNGAPFFRSALELLDGRQIPTLRIGDYNTTGLSGGDTENTSHWYRLVRCQGTSSIHGAGGGTFGIGQRAPFAFSKLRTVFYSTRTSDGVSRLMGKSILCSHVRTDGEDLRAVGFCGIDRSDRRPGVSPIVNDAMIPEVFARDEVGTDLFILGFEDHDWTFRVGRSIVEHFFAAVFHEKLVVVLKDGDRVTTIDRQTIESYQQELLARALEGANKAEQEDLRRGLGAVSHYLRALATEPKTAHINRLGRVSLYVALDKEAPSRTAFMRRPRIVVHQQSRRLAAPYAAVFLGDDDAGNRFLAGMEDHTHTTWDPDRSQERGAATTLRDLRGFVSKTLNEMLEREQPASEDMPDLSRYLPDDSLNDAATDFGKVRRTKDHQPEEAAHRQQKRTPLVVRRGRLATVSPSGSVPNEGGRAADEEGAVTGPGSVTEEGEGGDENDPGADPGSSEGGAPVPGGPGRGGARVLHPRDVRFRMWFDATLRRTRVVLTSARTGRFSLTLDAVGEDGMSYPVNILEARDEESSGDLPISGNTVSNLRLRAKAPRRLALRIEGDRPVALQLGGDHARS